VNKDQLVNLLHGQTVGERIVAIVAEQGYQLRDDDTSAGAAHVRTLRFGKGHWAPADEWVWDSADHQMITLELPEAWF